MKVALITIQRYGSDYHVEKIAFVRSVVHIFF